MIKQFLRDVDWGEMDFMLVDTPPGTSDEHLSIVQYLKATDITGAVVISTPQVEKRQIQKQSKLVFKNMLCFCVAFKRKSPYWMCVKKSIFAGRLKFQSLALLKT